MMTQTDDSAVATSSVENDHKHGPLGALALAAIGVVYGDIGTSPLYTMREAFGEHGGLDVHNPAHILGVLSLVFWAIMIVVSIKYVMVITRVDNRGEGGVLALSALASRGTAAKSRRRTVALFLGLLGASLFYGDGIITPAISVMSAVEGLAVAAPHFGSFVVPLSVMILLGLFVMQRYGTGRVGKLFGPVMCVWFVTLGLLGIINIVDYPLVFEAINPMYAVAMLHTDAWGAFVCLGAVVLAVTGGEALYADLGHFGRKPIQFAWFGLVLPGLLLNYFGQGALLLQEPAHAVNPFYLMAPAWALLPMVLLATMATIIASQAVISGAFSMTRQAIQLGYLPRLTVRHTSDAQIGQIYIPAVNWALLTGILALVLFFRSSSALASAYGIAVTGAMAIDAVLAFLVFRHLLGWSWLRGALVFGGFLVVDMAFLGATALKIPQGGWMPLTIAAILVCAMLTWRKGRKAVARELYGNALPLTTFAERLEKKPPTRVPGTAVFLTANPQVVPHALLHNLKHNKVLHDRVVFLTIVTEEVPRVAREDRVRIKDIGHGFMVIAARYGFAEQPNVPDILTLCEPLGLSFNMMETSFFVSREKLIPSSKPALPPLQERLFIAMSDLSTDATGFFRIPANRVVELGSQVEI